MKWLLEGVKGICTLHYVVHTSTSVQMESLLIQLLSEFRNTLGLILLAQLRLVCGHMRHVHANSVPPQALLYGCTNTTGTIY